MHGSKKDKNFREKIVSIELSLNEINILYRISNINKMEVEKYMLKIISDYFRLDQPGNSG